MTATCEWQMLAANARYPALSRGTVPCRRRHGSTLLDASWNADRTFKTRIHPPRNLTSPLVRHPSACMLQPLPGDAMLVWVSGQIGKVGWP